MRAHLCRLLSDACNLVSSTSNRCGRLFGSSLHGDGLAQWSSRYAQEATGYEQSQSKQARQQWPRTDRVLVSRWERLDPYVAASRGSSEQRAGAGIKQGQENRQAGGPPEPNSFTYDQAEREAGQQARANGWELRHSELGRSGDKK